VTESNVPVSTAVSLWRQYVEPAKSKFHFRLGSLATKSTPAGKAWLTEFFRQLGGGGASVDFVVVRWYGTDVHQLESFLADMHLSFGKPLWLAEFAYSRFGPEPAPTASEVEAFMRRAIPLLDTCHYVEQYAYFCAPTNIGSWGWRGEQLL
jgi:Glycosyl hydrolase catalytic core